VNLLDYTEDITATEARFRALTTKVDFDQYRQAPSDLACNPIESLGKLVSVDRVDRGEEFDCAARFV
jgi:hypothetical protein